MGCLSGDELDVDRIGKSRSEELGDEAILEPTVAGFGDFHSTALMFSYQVVALSGLESVFINLATRTADFDLGLNVYHHVAYSYRDPSLTTAAPAKENENQTNDPQDCESHDRKRYSDQEHGGLTAFLTPDMDRLPSAEQNDHDEDDDRDNHDRKRYADRET